MIKRIKGVSRRHNKKEDVDLNIQYDVPEVKTLTQSEVDDWVEDNVNSLDDAKEVLKQIIRTICVRPHTRKMEIKPATPRRHHGNSWRN